MIREKLTEDVIAGIHTEIGKISKELTAIQNSEFGFLGDEVRYTTLYDFVKQMLINLISDAEKKNIDIVYDKQFFLEELEKDEASFAEVKNA